MDRYYSDQRPPTRRRPLANITNRANSATPPQRPQKNLSTSSTPPPLPHNESIVPDGTLTVQDGDSRVSSGHKHVAAAAVSGGRDSKRDSAISNASTNASNTDRRRKTHVGPWQLGKTIGRGGCSRVRAVRHSISGQFGAAKIISKAMAENVRAISLANLIKSVEEEKSAGPQGMPLPFGLEREIVIMKLLEHRNIVRLYDVWENRNEIYLIMEYVQGGELFNYISERRGLDEDEVVYLFRQIIAALLYCHRINIHHRDLKPENILLDQSTFEIKLVDFGMAALQPAGKYLSTPCGSPHYAAPEVIRTKSYDGGKADVWSCGVILYVMLTGTPPFNYTGNDRDLKDLFSAIARADYVMPDYLSREAQDLIARILVPDPRKRINIQDIWEHPFLHKYDEDFGFNDEEYKLENVMGPRPVVKDWKPLTKKTVDRDILRNMRTLWHSEREEVLIQRLLDRELNQEKFFYSALVRHRLEQLENYYSDPVVMGYSASDYHHAQPADGASMPPLPRGVPTKSHSQYSIMNNEHLYSKHSFFEPPSSEISYDPFRASKSPMLANKSDVKVTVHRSSSRSSRARGRPITPSQRQSSSLRVETLKRNKLRGSGLSSSTSKKSSVARKTTSSTRRSVSRISMSSSSAWPSSPPVAFRKNSYRRGVSFSRLRRQSTANVHTAEPGRSQPQSTPTVPEPPPVPLIVRPGDSVRNPKQKTQQHRAQARPGKPSDTPGHVIAKEARKVSTELDKLCEEAFFRSSIESSIDSSMVDAHSPQQFETPPSSVSKKGSGLSNREARNSGSLAKETIQNRPLPPLPTETPNTFIARELLQTRDRLAARCAEEGDTTGNFDEVLAHLDRLLKPAMEKHESKRSISAPQPRHGAGLPGHLREEPAEPETGDGTTRQEGLRAVTHPGNSRPDVPARRYTDNPATIRVVDPSSPSPVTVAPLNIRKRSGVSTASNRSMSSNEHTALGPPPATRKQSSLRGSRDVERAIAALPAPREDEVLQPSPALPAKEPGTIKKKKSFWFRSRADDKEEAAPAPAAIPAAWQSLDDRVTSRSSPGAAHIGRVQRDKRKVATANKPANFAGDTPEFREVGLEGRKNKFFNLFSRWLEKRNVQKVDFAAAHEDLATPSIDSSLDYGSLPGDALVRNTSEHQVHWLARFLHIKPTTRTLCFCIPRGRARGELVRLLRDWRQFGVRDVALDRAAHAVSARVDRRNFLKIRPVAFAVEFFVVLEDGRRVGLCAARATQTKGAASSFRKVFGIVEDVLRTRGVLVEDAEKRAAMEEVFA